MSYSKTRNTFGAALLCTLLAATAGCPGPIIEIGDPPLAAFSVPEDATATRIRGGETIVYTVPNENDRTFEFFLAEPNEPAADHEMIGTVPAADLGFEDDEPLVSPTTISFADNLDRAVIGFEDGSYVLEANGGTAAQFIGTFTAFPLTAFGGTVFNPTISPFGNRLAFETLDGRVGTGVFDTFGGLSDIGLLDFGVDPVFGFDGTLGYADPVYGSYYVNDFTTGTFSTFDIGPAGFVNFGPPFSRFESGLTPYGVGGVGGFVGTSPLVIDPGPF